MDLITYLEQNDYEQFAFVVNQPNLKELARCYFTLLVRDEPVLRRRLEEFVARIFGEQIPYAKLSHFIFDQMIKTNYPDAPEGSEVVLDIDSELKLYVTVGKNQTFLGLDLDQLQRSFKVTAEKAEAYAFRHQLELIGSLQPPEYLKSDELFVHPLSSTREDEDGEPLFNSYGAASIIINTGYLDSTVSRDIQQPARDYVDSLLRSKSKLNLIQQIQNRHLASIYELCALLVEDLDAQRA